MSKQPKEKSEYVEIKLPGLSLGTSPVTSFLIFTLIIFAFLLGMLTYKVISLENNAKLAATTSQTGDQTAPPAPPQVVKVDNGNLPVLGDKNAKVTIVEFSDFQCPFCKRFVEETFSEIKEKYIDTGKVKFAFRHYPISSIHPNAQATSEAAECANEQNKFWEYHDFLFENQADWESLTGTDLVNTTLTKYAGNLGLNTDQFLSCLTSEKYKARVDEDHAAGTAVQVEGTPAFFVNGYRLEGAQPFSEFERIIEQELKK